MSVRPDGSVDVLPGILVQVDIRVECGTGPKQDYWSHVGDQRGSAVMSWIVMSGRDRGWEDSSWYQTIKAASMAGGELSARVMCSPCSCTASPCFQEVSRWDAVVCVTVS